MNIFQRLWRRITHRLELASDSGAVTLRCSCGWWIRFTGNMMWLEASHAWDIHLGISECPVCKRMEKDA